MFGFLKKENNLSSGGASSSEIYSDDYRTYNQQYRIGSRELKRGGGFIPIPVFGWLPLKTQKTIAYGMALIGLVGSFFVYQNYTSKMGQLPSAQRFFSQQLLDFKQKDLKLRLLNENAIESLISELQEELKTNSYLTSFSQNTRFLKDSNVVASFEVDDVIRKINSLSEMYSSQVVFPLEKQKALITRLNGLSERLNAVIKNVERGLKIGSTEEQNALFKVISVMESQSYNFGSKDIFTQLKSGGVKLVQKNNELLRQISAYSKQLLTSEHKSVYQSLQTLNTYFNEFNSTLRFASEVNVFIDPKLFEGIVKELETIQETISKKVETAANDTFLLKLFLVLLLLGVILSLLIWGKQYEFNLHETLNRLNKIEVGLREIENDIEIHNKDNSHRINSRGKTTRLESLVSGLNISWERELNRNIIQGKKVEASLKNLKEAGDIFERSQSAMKVVVNSLRGQGDQFNKLNEISRHFAKLNDLLTKEEIQIKAKDMLVSNYIEETNETNNNWHQKSLSVLDKVNFISEALNNLSVMAKDALFFSEEGVVLSFNADILANKSNVDNKSFGEVSSRIAKLSKKYSKLSETISGLTENIQTNFRAIDYALKNMKEEAELAKNNSANVLSKMASVKVSEENVDKGTQMLNNMLRQLNVPAISDSVVKVIEESDLQENYSTEFKFNLNSGETVLLGLNETPKEEEDER